MKNKNIISNISFLVMLFLLLTVKTAEAQSASDYVFIESTVPDYGQLQQQYNSNSNVYFNKSGKPALYVYNQMTQQLLINNLFVYVSTAPGILKFGSGNVTINNIDDYATDLSQLSKNVNGSIIIHSDNVFSGTSGASFKDKLEALTGLPVTMDLNQHPFSN